MAMTSRENVLAALSHRRPERVPKYAYFTPAIFERFREETGEEDYAAYFGFDVTYVGPGPTKHMGDFSAYHPAGTPNDDYDISEWGTGHEKGTVHHFRHLVSPLTGLADPAELDDFPWPDCNADYRWEHVNDQVSALHDQGQAVMGVPPIPGGTFYETAWQMRGMDMFLMDLLTDPPLAEALLDRIEAIQLEAARRMASADVDVLLTADDVGTQRGMMIAPDLWRHWFKPRMAKMIVAARDIKSSLHVFYHSDGNIEDIIPDLIEVGVDVLNPVQPECMDPVALKKQYGDRLSFWGTIGTQTTLPFGTPQEVRDTVRRMIEEVGRNGGLVLAPTHFVEPDVPWENIVAMFEAIEEFGTQS